MLTFKMNEEGLGTLFPADPAAYEEKLEALRGIVSEVEDHLETPEKAIEAVGQMVAADPFFVQGAAILGEMLNSTERDEEAEELYVKSCLAILKIMPKDFAGPMDVVNNDVQCFLRCHTGYVDALTAKGEYAEALKAALKQLAFDPEDLFARRLDLGELYIRNEDWDQAEKELQEQSEERPTAWYSLGYLYFVRGDYPRAAAHLRRGFLRSPYVVDFLTARLTAPNIFWDAAPMIGDYQEDMSYLEMLGGDLWSENREAHDFIEWLSQTSPALMDRARLVALAEGCFDRSIPTKEAEKTYAELWNALTPEAAEKMTGLVSDPQTGAEVYPWSLLNIYHEQMYQEGDFDEDDDDDCGCGCGCGGHDKH